MKKRRRPRKIEPEIPLTGFRRPPRTGQRGPAASPRGESRIARDTERLQPDEETEDESLPEPRAAQPARGIPGERATVAAQHGPRPRLRLTPALLLHVDEDLLIVDKPAGVLSVPGWARDDNLPQLLRGRLGLPADEPFRVVHRIDREASGVLVYARNVEAQRALVRQFEKREVEKVYWAMVQGYVESDGQVDLPLELDRSGTTARIARRRGKPSLTLYRVVERLPGNTLLECRPVTGRTHQIRVHMAAAGHPLTVDPLYGGGQAVMLSSYKSDYRRSRRHDERPLIDRLTLHALRITLQHPRGGGPLTVEAPLPKDFRATLTQLRRLLTATG